MDISRKTKVALPLGLIMVAIGWLLITGLRVADERYVHDAQYKLDRQRDSLNALREIRDRFDRVDSALKELNFQISMRR